jgi:hypothetical protein
MGIVFNYGDRSRLHKLGLNPRETFEVEGLIMQTGKLPRDKDGSRGEIFKHAWTRGTFARHVHVLCPLVMIHSATNPKLFTTENTFQEWLFVSVKKEIYLMVVRTRRTLSTGKSTSEIYEVSGKNPRIDWKDWKCTAKEFVPWWLTKCRLKVQASPRPMPIIRPSLNGAVQRYPNASGAPAAVLGGQDSPYNSTSDPSAEYNDVSDPDGEYNDVDVSASYIAVG